MTRKDIVRRVAEKTGEKQVTIAWILDCILEELAASLVSGERIELRDFGVFSIVKRKARLARNPKTGEPVQVPERLAVRFKPGRLLKERVAESGKGTD